MRTSIDIDNAILCEAKKFALDSHKSFGTIVEDALRVMLVKKNSKEKLKKISLVTCNGKGLNHGVDLDNNKSLLDIMDN